MGVCKWIYSLKIDFIIHFIYNIVQRFGVGKIFYVFEVFFMLTKAAF